MALFAPGCGAERGPAGATGLAAAERPACVAVERALCTGGRDPLLLGSRDWPCGATGRALAAPLPGFGACAFATALLPCLGLPAAAFLPCWLAPDTGTSCSSSTIWDPQTTSCADNFVAFAGGRLASEPAALLLPDLSLESPGFATPLLRRPCPDLLPSPAPFGAAFAVAGRAGGGASAGAACAGRTGGSGSAGSGGFTGGVQATVRGRMGSVRGALAQGALASGQGCGAVVMPVSSAVTRGRVVLPSCLSSCTASACVTVPLLAAQGARCALIRYKHSTRHASGGCGVCAACMSCYPVEARGMRFIPARRRPAAAAPRR